MTEQPSDFYFWMMEIPDPEEDEPSHGFLFISKKFWDAGEGLDCVPEPEYLYNKLDEMFGDDSDATMENTWVFCNRDPHQVKQQLLDIGFVENSKLGGDPIAAEHMY